MMTMVKPEQKLLAVYNVNLKTRGHLGVMRKVVAQAQGFSLNHKQVHMVCGDGPNIVRLVFEAGSEVQREIISTAVKPGDFFVHVAAWIAGQQEMACAFEWAYVRYNPMHNDELLQLARRLHEATVPLFIEMYTLEYQNELPADAAIRDQYYRLQLAPWVTGFFTPSFVREPALFLQRPLYKMGNGATWVSPQKPESLANIDWAFNLIGVGYLAPWHGYDRLFTAIPEFIKASPEVALRITLVGQGPGAEALRKEAQQAGVENWVEFTGALDAEQLANRYVGSHVALGTLGFHRTGVGYAEPLKHREFMLYGLPFIYSVEDVFSNITLPGVWMLPADDSPVDLIWLYQEYKKLDRKDVAQTLRTYAEIHYSWVRQTANILQTMRAACV
ncbi:glycosyltransferase family 4 protein [Aeromonas caviae]|uniref:Glycosyltransferase n=2 Tax=Aeromonas caviae TaxID=648 RepID=A0AA43AIS8_AERCA|nr:glycosyltransferase [Aeromonas caviae]MCV3279252.1 glycosyltransferase [Aeromonas caviae]MDH1897619.1 glycosyltransferase [Aeromonas caviae]MDX7706289.1 glycosyltransferase [Aeromonas caviae]MDX7768021.1 glycosyltransferase [Aeromonas caviae]MDX7796792.1 glycosyltransferase [Aeromonas caviae]